MKHDTVMLQQLLSRKRWDPRAHVFRPESNDESPSEHLIAIGSLATERREQSKPPGDPTATFIYLGLENVESVTGDLVRDVRRSGGEVLSASKRFRPGDVLISRLRPNLNKVCCPEIGEGYCSGEFIVLSPNTELTTPRVLRELLASPDLVARLVDLVAGATLPRISATDLMQQRVRRVDPAKLATLTMSLKEEDGKRKLWKKELAEQPARLANVLASCFV